MVRCCDAVMSYGWSADQESVLDDAMFFKPYTVQTSTASIRTDTQHWLEMMAGIHNTGSRLQRMLADHNQMTFYHCC